jgi:hypothetical protein
MPQKRPGFNEPGGWGERIDNIAAILRDDPGVYESLQNRRAQAQDREAQMRAAQERAQAEEQQWYQREQWKRNNPEPSDPPPEQRLVEWVDSLPPDKRQHALDMIDQFRPKVIGDPVSGYQYMPRPNGLAGTYTQPPANGILGTELPPGWKIEGGSGGNATGGFRR